MKLKDERRNVVVLFAKISGLSSETNTLSFQDMFTRHNFIFRSLSDIIYKYEGYIDKYMGGEIMALFGAPISHENNSLRAVLCSIEMLSRIRDFPGLKISIGLNFGLVFAGGVGSDRRMDYTVMGDTVNLAQRLESAAGPNQIYASETVFKATRKEIEYKKLKPITVKGINKPVTPYLPHEIKSRFIFHGTTEYPLEGREKEIALLFKVLKLSLIHI